MSTSAGYISVLKLVGEFCRTPIDGRVLRTQIQPCIERQIPVLLSFAGVKEAHPDFLNELFGEIYRRYTVGEIATLLAVTDTEALDRRQFRLAIDNALAAQVDRRLEELALRASPDPLDAAINQLHASETSILEARKAGLRSLLGRHYLESGVQAALRGLMAVGRFCSSGTNAQIVSEADKPADPVVA